MRSSPRRSPAPGRWCGCCAAVSITPGCGTPAAASCLDSPSNSGNYALTGRPRSGKLPGPHSYWACRGGSSGEREGIEQPAVLVNRVPVCHAGDVVGDRADQPALAHVFLNVRRQHLRGVDVGVEEALQDRIGLPGHADEPVVEVEVVIEERSEEHTSELQSRG